MTKNMSDPTYFPEVLYVYHGTSFPATFFATSKLENLPDDVKFVGTYHLEHTSEVSREVTLVEVK